MKVVIPGGSGQVGTMLARAFTPTGHEVVVLSRAPRPRAVAGRRLGRRRRSAPWAAELDGADVVINLAGRSVNCRYTRREPPRRSCESRVASRRGSSARRSRAPRRPPRVWLQASTATIYAHRYDAANDEATGVIGGAEPDAPDTWRFSIDVATGVGAGAATRRRRRARGRCCCARR